MSLIRKTSAATLLAVALAASGCGNGGATGSASAAKSPQSFQDAMVDYAACMRDHGVDMPDPVAADGTNGAGMVFSVPVGSSDGSDTVGSSVDTSSFQEASTACQPILDAAQQDAPKMSAEDEAKMRDGALKFAQCMREHGIDMPDPTFDTVGGSKIAISGAGVATAVGNVGGDTPLDSQAFNDAADACNVDGAGGPHVVVGSGAVQEVGK